MRRILVTAALGLAVAMVTGCKPPDRTTSQMADEIDSLKAELDQASQHAQDAQEDLEDCAFSRKAEYVAKMGSDLSDIQKELDRLSGEVVSSASDAKAESREQLDAVRKQWVAAKTELDKAEAAEESDWKRVKVAFKRANEDLKASFEKTRLWLSDKIEP